MTDPTPVQVHTWYYEFLKDFQPALAAAIALTAAVIAYRGAIAKVNLDRAISERESANRKLGFYRRLKIKVGRLESTAAANTYELKLLGEGKISEIVNNPYAFPEFKNFSELDEAWSNLALFPIDAVSEIEFLQRSLNDIDGLFRPQQGKLRSSEFYIKLIDNLVPVCRSLQKTLDREIAKLENPAQKWYWRLLRKLRLIR